MNSAEGRFVIVFLTILFSECLISTGSVGSAVLYKNYVVCQDKGEEILSSPYIVQKDDWLLKIFRQRGEISERDFPEFLMIFRRINPNIPDINTIQPGQHILIPIKKIEPDTLPGQSSGRVTIPFVSLSNIPDTLEAYSSKYTVKKGDCVSILISRRYGPYGTKSYKEGIKTFKLINPDLPNLNHIYQGQSINLPDPSIKNQPWYESLFDNSGNISTGNSNSSGSADSSLQQTFQPELKDNRPDTPFSQAASILNAKLLNKGTYYFPRQGKEDLKIDLSLCPFIELKNSKKFLFLQKNKMQEYDCNLIESIWNNIDVIRLPDDSSLKEILDSLVESIKKNPSEKNLSFSDHDIQVKVNAQWIFDTPSCLPDRSSKTCVTIIRDLDETTSEPICRYLKEKNIIIKDKLKDDKILNRKTKRPEIKPAAADVVSVDFSDHKTFVKNLLLAMGQRYAEDISVTFPYAGIQIEAVSNLLSIDDGNHHLLVDFGDLYGDAVNSIEKTGFKILQIKADDDCRVIIQKLLTATDLSYTIDPTFLAAKRPALYNTALTIPGFLVTERQENKIFLTAVPLPKEVVQFLNDDNIKIIKVQKGKEI